VYRKALRLKLWNIVRQASGLLRKVASSLTINLTDLLIRQKQITFSSGENEVIVSTPLPPDTLVELIYKQW
jgi:hypothetical protein